MHWEGLLSANWQAGMQLEPKVYSMAAHPSSSPLPTLVPCVYSGFRPSPWFHLLWLSTPQPLAIALYLQRTTS